MNTIQRVAVMIFGRSWRTTLVGYLGVIAIECAPCFDAGSQPRWHHVLAAALLVIGRVMKDAAREGAAEDGAAVARRRRPRTGRGASRPRSLAA